MAGYEEIEQHKRDDDEEGVGVMEKFDSNKKYRFNKDKYHKTLAKSNLTYMGENHWAIKHDGEEVVINPYNDSAGTVGDKYKVYPIWCDEVVVVEQCNKQCNQYVSNLTHDYYRLKVAGTDLAIAAMRVIRDYDGVHRLSLAVAEWNKAVAGEGGRTSSKKQHTQRSQFYTCPECGTRTDDLACCYYDEEEAGHD